MNKYFKTGLIILIVIAVFWTLLTLWVQREENQKHWESGNPNSLKNVLIVYDPDPIYNLDEQVSRSFGKALADNGIKVIVATVSYAREIKDKPFSLYVFCANTYNWSPDWAVSNFIKELELKNRQVVAITLGSGSTEASQKELEKIILDKGANLMDTRSLWLLKPNDESRMKESNVQVSVSIAYTWGEKIAKQMLK